MLPPEVGIGDFLDTTPEPPSKTRVADAIRFLQVCCSVNSHGITEPKITQVLETLDENEALTPLGLWMADLSLSPRLAVTLLHGCLLGCIQPVSHQSLPFRIRVKSGKPAGGVDCGRPRASRALLDGAGTPEKQKGNAELSNSLK